MKCELCHEREATIHSTYVVEEALTHVDLCGDCFEASAPLGARELQKGLQTGCRYCGGKPYCGSGYFHGTTDAFVGPGSGFMCKLCADEYFRYLRQKVPGFGDPDPTTEQIAEIASHDMSSVLMETDNHMKKWVTKRGT